VTPIIKKAKTRYINEKNTSFKLIMEGYQTPKDIDIKKVTKIVVNNYNHHLNQDSIVFFPKEDESKTYSEGEEFKLLPYKNSRDQKI